MLPCKWTVSEWRAVCALTQLTSEIHPRAGYVVRHCTTRWVADRAKVSMGVARNALDKLVNLGVISKAGGKFTGGATYRVRVF